jgi:predicted NAD/FAD-binding protein
LSRLNIAIVGSGISGCAAAWDLSRWAKVTVFEAEPRLGGHTHTQTACVEGLEFPVDTGFIVFNHRTYPGLKAWFEALGVECAPSEMSFSASLNRGQIEWCGTSLNSIFAQRKNIVSPRFLTMLKSIVRFNREAPQDAAIFRASGQSPSLGDYLDQRGYRSLFLDAYLLPMAGAIWSCPTEQMRAFPMTTFTQFCENHGLLSLTNRPQWYTVRQGAQQYIRRLIATLDRENRPVDWRTGSKVESVRTLTAETRGRHGVVLSGMNPAGQAFDERFDAVLLACHSDQSAKILSPAHPAQSVVGAIRYQDNTAYLHTDKRLMPQRQLAWAAWNYLHENDRADHERGVSVTYWMNRLQPLPVATPVLVTLNPLDPPADNLTINTMHYAHPVFDGPAVAAQSRLDSVQGAEQVWLAGAWTRYGFHEDGFQSGIRAAQQMAAELSSIDHEPSIPQAA